VTNDLKRRLFEHKEDSENSKETFAGKYNTVFLIYYERFQYVEHAIKKEKEIKSCRREKKINLINSFNKEWKFLNNEVFE